MPEVADAGEDHGEIGLVRSLDHFVITHRTAGLDHGGGAGLRSLQQTIGEREESVGGAGRSEKYSIKSSGYADYVSKLLDYLHGIDPDSFHRTHWSDM